MAREYVVMFCVLEYAAKVVMLFSVSPHSLLVRRTKLRRLLSMFIARTPPERVDSKNAS